MLQYLNYVENSLHLTFNNITRLDIALTSTYDYIKAITKSIENIAGLDMIYNIKRVTDPDRQLKDYSESFGRSRRKRLPNPTLYFGHKKRVGTQVKVYDKLRELENNSPEKIEYLNKWLGFEYDKLYRIEIRLTNPQVREICSRSVELLAEWEHGENLTNILQIESFMTFAFDNALYNVLHFRKGRESINVLDL